MATTVTPTEVKERFPGQTSKSDSTIQDIIDEAERLTDNIYSGQVAREGELQGDRDDFIRLIALHKLTLSEGGEMQSESQTGGTVNYNLSNAGDGLGLSQTRFGREASTYLREEISIGFELT